MVSVDQESGDDEENPSFVSPIQNSAGGGDAIASDPPPAAIPAVSPQPPTQVGDPGRPLADQVAAGADPEKEILKYQLEISQLKLEVQAAKLEAAEQKLLAQAAGSTHESVTSKADEHTEEQRHKLHEHWDSLLYVPVGELRGNPFRGPDQPGTLKNPDRPQCFPLDNDPTLNRLINNKQSIRYEYQILHPVLYYYYGLQEFLKRDLRAALEDPDVEVRLSHWEAVVNTSTRIYEWLTTRHALLQVRSRLQTEGHTGELLAHLQDQVYGEVGQDPPTNVWVTKLEEKYRQRVRDATTTQMVKQEGQAKAKASGSTGSRQTPPGQGKEGQFKPKVLKRSAKKDESQ